MRSAIGWCMSNTVIVVPWLILQARRVPSLEPVSSHVIYKRTNSIFFVELDKTQSIYSACLWIGLTAFVLVHANFLISTFLVITTRIRMMGKVLFSQVSVCPHPGKGVPQSQVFSQVTGSRSFPGGIPVLGPFWGYPSPRFFPRSLVPGSLGGTPVPSSFLDHQSQVLSGCTPVLGSFPGHWFQVLSKGTLVLTGGTHSGWGYLTTEYPQPGQDGVPTWPGQDGIPPLPFQDEVHPPARSGWGTPWPGQNGVPPSQDRN